MDTLAREVVTFTAAAKMITSIRPSGSFASSPAFNPTVSEVTISAFESIVLNQLLWPAAARPSFEECCATVHACSDAL